MRNTVAPSRASPLRIRRGEAGDLDALLAIERGAFQTERISRRSFARFIRSPSATLLVAETGGRISGYALVLYRANARVARLYSIAVAAANGRRGIGAHLLESAESDGRARGRSVLRLEVSARNDRAVALYRTKGYRLFGRRAGYYGDGSDALRFEKPLAAST